MDGNTAHSNFATYQNEPKPLLVPYVSNYGFTSPEQ